MTLRYLVHSTRMPTVSAATGCSPTARTRSPHRVRNRPIWITRISAYVMYRKMFASKKIGPMIGMLPSTGILIVLNVLPALKVFA